MNGACYDTEDLREQVLNCLITNEQDEYYRRGTTLISEAHLKTILNQFHQQRILVIGDFYLDAYWYIDKTQSTLSLETPWHTNPVVAQHYSPGAAGTVTNNLKALGVGSVYTLGVIGADGFGGTLLNCLQANGCLTDFMIQVPELGHAYLSQTDASRL